MSRASGKQIRLSVLRSNPLKTAGRIGVKVLVCLKNLDMNETSVKQDSKEVPNPTLFGLPKPLVGALIGILLLLSITLPFEFMPTNTNVPAKLAIIAFGFQFWGILPAMLSNGIVRVLGFNLPALANTFIVVVASCIPPALLGWMIASYKSSTKVLGIILLVIYIIISQIFGFAMARLTI